MSPASDHRAFYRRVDDVFALLADLGPEERAAALERECGGDARLRREVESLLANDGHSGLIRDLVGREAAAIQDGTEIALIGRRFGAWKTSAILGRGGMGAVYEVWRDDGAFRQRAALKILRTELDTDRSRRRFWRERQILAQLNHPNIARLLDGGASDDGMPYLVMEAVDGLPITEYCDRHALTVTQRLQLFVTVCLAVQAAHALRIIHRDLKPSNILVSEDGTVKLLDFGIAGLLDRDATALEASSEIAFTPAYASPEQRRGEPVTPASDIYALGTVLLEMLAGDTFGERNAIVRKALRHDPRQRYGSVAQLLADVKSHLTGGPVTALSHSRTYRVRVFARRNRVVLAVASAMLLTILAAITASVWQMRRTEQRLQLELAAANLRTAEILLNASRPSEAEVQATEGLTRALSHRAPPDLVADLYALRRRARLGMGNVAGAAADAERERTWRRR
ncbi:MAG TPA: serine/threonine-protein kinase [Thermoanaerobaculia bacterium]|nr:serine/threonine-protein kinase [Thermoanaerobaculia bacterium]